jgi:2-oxoglutarate dehydrogenase E1 component
LLRLPAASSTVEELTTGGFKPVIDDSSELDPQAVKRIVLCSGKLYYDLAEARKKSEERRLALVRLEQFYPFPRTAIQNVLKKYPNASQLVWAQEEPQNMGGWTFMEERLTNILSARERPRYVGRTASASPATGSYHIHQKEQTEIVTQALSVE